MKKLYSFTKLALTVLCLCTSLITVGQDFNIQHIENDIGNADSTNVAITPVSSLNNAFALPTNNRKTHGGLAITGSTTLDGRDLAGSRRLTETDTITFYRESTSVAGEMRFNTSIWEYIGPSGGPNEMIVRNRYAVSLDGSVKSATRDLTGLGISSSSKCIPFITGIMNNAASDDADAGTAIAYLSDATTLTVLKGGTDTPNVTVYITLVEFTGSNWTVLHGDSGTSALDSGTITLKDNADGTSGTTTSVTDWANAIIFGQHIGNTASAGTNDALSDNWPIFEENAALDIVDWSFNSDHDGNGRHFVHVLNNSSLSVERYSSNTSNLEGESTIALSTPLKSLNEAFVVGSSTSSGTSAAYPRGWRNYYLNDVNTLAHWAHRSGNTMKHELQVVDFSGLNSFAPGGISSNLTLWLRADDGVENASDVAALDGETVINWLDGSLNENDATQNSSSARPLYNDSGINFNPTVDFDGTNHELLANISADDNTTIYAVTEGSFNSTDRTLIIITDPSSREVMLEQTSGTNLRGQFYDGNNSGIANITIANNTPFMTHYRHSRNNNNLMFVNGASGTFTVSDDTAFTGASNVSIGGKAASSRWDGQIAELIVFSKKINGETKRIIDSYLAIKYGITLGGNGSVQSYKDSNGSKIWDTVVNSNYDNDITGIGRDDVSRLNQKQSKTLNTTDDITIGLKGIESSNQENTSEFFADRTFLMWGNNGLSTAANSTVLSNDFGSGTNLEATRINRIWKMVVQDSVPTVKLSIPESMVSSTYSGTEDYIMIVADDAGFTSNVTAATMTLNGTDLEVDWYFEGEKFVSFGTSETVSISSRAAYFNNGFIGTTPKADAYLDAGDVNDLNNTNFTISAWVRRDTGATKFDIVSKRNYFNEDVLNGIEGIYSQGYAFRVNKDGNLRLVWRDLDHATNNQLQTVEVIPENQWHHVAATYNSGAVDGQKAILYIDGLPVYDDADFLVDKGFAIKPLTDDTDAHFMIGAAHHIKRQQKIKGSIDEVRIWKTALTENQIQYIMNQEIEENSGLADGKTLPSATSKNTIKTVPWNQLIAYYPMNNAGYGRIKDESGNGKDLSMINFDDISLGNSIEAQTAPLPYESTQDGDWDDPDTWVNGDVQYLPGVVSYIDPVKTIDWNIVQINNNITMDNTTESLIPAAKNEERVLLGLMVNSNTLTVGGVSYDDTILPGEVSGNAVNVSHYLKLNGKIDLVGESQLIQTEDSDLDITSSGTLEKDQQGTQNTFTYNYWSSPVGGSGISSNNNSYTLSNNILKDGTNSLTPINMDFVSGYNGSTGEPIGIAKYWIWKYNNRTSDDYASWQHIRNTGSLDAGEGFTMKGPDAAGDIALEQNYTFEGKPNNGDISVPINSGNDYLVGNPYSSAINADTFILDNTNTTGALYFWEHFGGGTHNTIEYQGGYAIYNLSGGTPAIQYDYATGGTVSGGDTGSKTPGKYIPVAQGFFVTGISDGTINFENDQRIFIKEDATSVFVRNDDHTSAREDVDNRLKIRLGFESSNTYQRQLLVTRDSLATNQIDFGYDAVNKDIQSNDMFWMIDDERFIIQGTNTINATTVLPIGILTSENGINTFKIDALENVPSDLEIYIHDKSLETYHDLRSSNFEIDLPAGEYMDRFEITFTPQSLSVDEVESNSIDIHYANENNNIVISNPKNLDIQSVKMINMTGQVILEFNEIETNNAVEIKTKNLSVGSYILHLKTEIGDISKKVLVK